MNDQAGGELTSLEMKCGLLDVAEALRFLHQDAKTAHLGIAPAHIFVTEHGRWLLGGFGYAQQGVVKGTAQDCAFAFQADDFSQVSPDPPLKYCAPEITAHRKFGLESDVFSLGMVAYEVMSKERRPLLAAVPFVYDIHPNSVCCLLGYGYLCNWVYFFPCVVWR